ncbi:MAG: hypothetical protein MUQ50_09240 [Paracoccaceae bacterium]|jgi:hypothetical protein|nr:hypothetical protein [Paracoccaceae bacterium]
MNISALHHEKDFIPYLNLRYAAHWKFSFRISGGFRVFLELPTDKKLLPQKGNMTAYE